MFAHLFKRNNHRLRINYTDKPCKELHTTDHSRHSSCQILFKPNKYKLFILTIYPQSLVTLLMIKLRTTIPFGNEMHISNKCNIMKFEESWENLEQRKQYLNFELNNIAVRQTL